MNTQVFLFLKKTGDIDSILKPSAGSNSPKDWITGDALEVPFIKWIRVTGLSHAIGFSESSFRYVDGDGNPQEKKYGSSAGSYAESFGSVEQLGVQTAASAWADPVAAGGQDDPHTTEAGTAEYVRGLNRHGRRIYRAPQGQTFSQTRTTRGGVTSHGDVTRPEGFRATGEKHRTGGRRFFTKFKQDTGFANAKLPINLPSHNELTFTKGCDNATPQIAFACSAQEPIRHAFFAFRRKIGLGVEGIRVPYLVVWLKQCLVTGWGLSGDEETVTLQYETIKWCTYDQMTDWNAPTGMSNREWDTQDNAGGEDVAMYVKMGLLAGATVALGAGLAAGMGAAFKSKLGTDSGTPDAAAPANEALEGSTSY